MEKKEVINTVFVADDGKIFDDEENCIIYEKGLKHVHKWFKELSSSLVKADGARYNTIYYVNGIDYEYDEDSFEDEPGLSVSYFNLGFDKCGVNEDYMLASNFERRIEDKTIQELSQEEAVSLIKDDFKQSADKTIRIMMKDDEE